MKKASYDKLVKQLKEEAPDAPSLLTRRGSGLITRLFELAPEQPFKRVAGIESVEKMSIPSSPNQKK